MKQKLLLALLALFTLGWTNARAQSWQAEEVAAGNYHLYNVGKGQFLTRGNGWGTQASASANSALTLIVEEYNGAYKLRTNVNGSGKGLERLVDPVIYTDQSANKNSTWTFTKVADASNGPVYTIVSKDNHNGGAGSYMTASADNTIVGPADAVNDDYGHWQLLKAWITNSQPVNDANGWTTSQDPTFDSGNVCAEFWNKSGASIKQTLQNLPAGNYELIAVALTRTGYVATLHAGSNTMNIATASTSEANNRGEANTWFNGGHGVNKLEFTHAGGNLEIGLTADNANGDHWLVWRSFVLIYKGLDYTRYNNVKSAALAVSPNVNTTDADDAVAAAKTNEELDAAISTLRASFLTELSNVTIPTDPGYIDVTAVMVDNASVRQNTDYWTIEGTANGNNSFGKCAYNECEFYGANFKFYQTLALTPGTWEFGVTGFHRGGQGEFNTDFYAGVDKISIPGVESSVVNSMAAAETYFNNGNGKVALKFLIEEADNVEIGINNQDTETDKWTIFRDFTLKYYGAPDYSVYVARLAELATEAAAVKGTVPAAVYTVLNGVVTEKNTTHANKAEYLAAIAAIENAITEAKEKQGAYASYKSLNTLVQALYDVANYEELTEGAHETLGTALGNAATEVETKTTIEDINAVAETLRAAGATYAGAANPTGEAKFNLTFMLTNPDVSSFPAWTAREDVPGWYTDQTDGNSQTMVNDDATSEDGTKTNFFEYWSNPAKANNLFALYQKVTLPLGTFDIKCYAFAQDQYAGLNSVGVYFYANDTQGSAVTTARLTEASLSFINDAEQEVKIGLKTIAGNTYNWMGIGYMELYKVPANTTEYAIITNGVENATVVATVDGETVTGALALKNVTLTVTANEGYLVDDVTVTYVDGEETKNVDLAKTDAGYTFQMPAFDVTVNVTTVALATAEDYEALNNLINSYVIGFDENEYSPYMNIVGIKAIAAAKAIDQTAENTKQVVEEAKQAIHSAGWIGNAVEVNAVYDGTLKKAPIQATSENVVLPGWVTKSGNIRQTFKGTGEDGKAALADAIDQVGVFVHPGKYTYGETMGYTMPLKGGVVYRAEAKYCAWADASNNNFTLTILKDGETIATKSYGANPTACTEAGALKQVYLYFTPEENGDYVLDVVTDGNTFMTDFIIKRAVAENVIINEATYVDGTAYEPVDKYANVTFNRTLVEGWNGLVLPFDMTVEDAKTKFNATLVKDFTDVTYDAEKGATLVFSDATEIKAGKPFMIKSAAGTEYTFEGVQLKSDALQTISQQAGEAKYTMTGTYQKVDLTNANFVLIQGDKFYQHNTNKASSAKAFRAYFLNESTGEALSKGINIDFNGEATGIKLVEDAQNSMNGDIYNLQGQKVNHAQKGVYIVNGKKIVVK